MQSGRDIRASIDTETVRGLQLINGGMAAGLVTLLPSVILDGALHSLARWMVVAIAFGAGGLVAAVVHNRLRRKCSLEYSKAAQKREPPFKEGLLSLCQSVPDEPAVCTKSVVAMWLSLIFFMFGSLSVGIGFYMSNNGTPAPTAPCWDIRYLSSGIVRFNKCTGETVSLGGAVSD